MRDFHPAAHVVIVDLNPYRHGTNVRVATDRRVSRHWGSMTAPATYSSSTSQQPSSASMGAEGQPSGPVNSLRSATPVDGEPSIPSTQAKLTSSPSTSPMRTTSPTLARFFAQVSLTRKIPSVSGSKVSTHRSTSWRLMFSPCRQPRPQRVKCRPCLARGGRRYRGSSWPRHAVAVPGRPSRRAQKR